MIVKCYITRCIHKNEDYRIFACIPNEDYPELKLNEKYGNFSIVGELPYLSEGKEYVLDIEEGVTDRYGTSYIVKDVPSMMVQEITDDMEYDILCDITTPRQAQYINSAYPQFVQMIVEGREDEIDVNNIYNVKDSRLAFLIREINAKYKYFIIMKKFKEYKLDIEECKDLNRVYKSLDEITKNLEESPYNVLIETLGRSFTSSDKTILENRPELRESFQRTEHLVLDVLNDNQYDGNTRINAREMSWYAKQRAPECLKNMKEVAIKSPLIYYDEKTNFIARMDTYLAECEIACFIKDRIKNSTKLDIDWAKYTEVDGFQLTKQQAGFLENFCNYSFSILCGYSGTGKTSSVVALISLLEDNDMTYTLLAPTGRASARLKECVNRSTSTMHRALAGDAVIGTDVVILDEFSFFGTDWTQMFIRGIVSPQTRIVLIGDNAQLAPISHGRVFQDLIDSGIVPMTMLDVVFRYADGGMLKVATDIRNGKIFLSNEPLQKFGKDYEFIESENILDDVLSKYMELIQKGAKPSDIMCLSPFNVGTEGTLNINSHIQSIINPAKPNQITHSIKVDRKQVFFRLGDYVMNTQNDYKALPLEIWEMMQQDPEFEPDPRTDLTSVFNGDLGKIVGCDEKKIVVQFGEEMIVYNKGKMNQLRLGYSISTHKSQGSQSKFVINISSPIHSKMLTRELLYVADTRASQKHFEIGNIRAIEEAIMTQDCINRDTFLLELLTEVNQ